MIIKFENEYKEKISFEIEIKNSDTFIKEKQEEMFKKILKNSSYKVIE